MATTVGQHGVTAFTNPSNGDALDATVVKGNDNTLRAAYVDHDSDPGIHVQSSATALRPAAGVVGRKWMTYDGTSPRIWYDDGTAWREISYLSSSPTSATFSGTVSATLVTASGVTATGTVQTGSLIVNGQLDVTNPSWHIVTRQLVYMPSGANWSGSVTANLTPLNFIDLTGNATVTLNNALSLYTGMYMAVIRQDSIGGRTLSFTNVLFPGGTTPTQTATANKADLWLFIAYNNTTFYGVRLAANL